MQISLCYNCPLLRTGLDTRLLPSLFFLGVLGTCRGVGVGVSLALRTNGACRVSLTSPKEWPASLTRVSLMLPLIVPASFTRVSATPALALLTGLEARLPPNLFLCGVFGHCGIKEEGVSLERRCNEGSVLSLGPPLRHPASHLRCVCLRTGLLITLELWLLRRRLPLSDDVTGLGKRMKVSDATHLLRGVYLG